MPKNNIQKLYAFPYWLFKETMSDKLGLEPTSKVPEDLAIISISSEFDAREFGDTHYFNEADNVLNIDFDDCDPRSWNIDLDLDDIKDDDLTFTENDGYVLHAMSPTQAKKIAEFIVKNQDKDFYIHCSAGRSRSQGVVKAIQDSFDKEFETIDWNPCITPNIYVSTMIKRQLREIL